MTPAIDFSPAEWDLLLELVEREAKQLPVEIHHTATSRYREHLRDRLDKISALLDKVNEATRSPIPVP